MPSITARVTFNLPYHMNVTEGEVKGDIVIPLRECTGRVIIHPPNASEERFITFESREKKVWRADIIEMDFEMELASVPPLNDLSTEINRMAPEYAKRLVKYMRARTKQFWFDLRAEMHPSKIVFIDGGGREIQTYGMVLSRITLGEPPSLDDKSWEAVSQDLVSNAEIRFEEELLLDAKLYRLNGDYRMAALSAAMGIEVVTNKYLGKKLTEHLVDTNRTSRSQVDKFLDAMSNRVLVTVGLGMFSTLDEEVLESCRKSLELRNDILHGMRRSVSREEVNEAVKSLAEVLSSKEIQESLEV